MATQAQRNANAANARKSTGPRTENGRARSARNATSHGLTSREVIVRPAEQDDFDQLVEAHRSSIHPEGALQETVFSQLVAAAWNLRRVRILQAELFDGDLDPLANPEFDARCDRLARYEQRFERALYRAIAELRRLQTDAAAIAMAVNEEDAPDWSPLVNVRHVLTAFSQRRAADVAQLTAIPLDLLDAA